MANINVNSNVVINNVSTKEGNKMNNYEVVIMKKIAKRFKTSFAIATQIVKEHGARNACSHAPIVIPAMAEENAAWAWYYGTGNATIEAARAAIRANETAAAAKKAEREAENLRIASGGDRNWSRMFSIINAFVDKAKAEAVMATNVGLAAFKAIANGFEADALKGESVKEKGQGATHMSATQDFNFDLQLFASRKEADDIMNQRLADFIYEIRGIHWDANEGYDGLLTTAEYCRFVSIAIDEDLEFCNVSAELESARRMGEAVEDWIERLEADDRERGLAEEYVLQVNPDCLWIETEEERDIRYAAADRAEAMLKDNFEFDLQLFAAGVSDEAVASWLIEELEDFNYEVFELKTAPGRDDISVISPYERQISSLERYLNINMPDSMFNMPSALRAGETCASADVDFNFDFDLQLFAAGKEFIMNKHLNNEREIHAMKDHSGNALAYCVRIIPTDNVGNVYAILDTAMAEINPLTRNYLQNLVKFQNLAKRETITKRGFVGYAALDVSAMASSPYADVRAAGAAIMQEEIWIGDYKGETVVALTVNTDTLQIISSKPKKNGNKIFINKSVAVNADGILKDNWVRYNSFKNYGASKGRKNLADMYSEDSDFETMLNNATYGEWAFKKHQMLTGKEIADATVRLGSKSTRMGMMDIIVNNVLVILDKDNNRDGAGLLSETLAKKGYLLQVRPYTGKGAVLVVAQEVIDETVRDLKIAVFDHHNMTAEEIKDVQCVLDKPSSKKHKFSADDFKAKYNCDAILLQGDASKSTEMIGDLNFFKDAWTFTLDSGVNVLNVAHFDGDFMCANTSGQMLKVVMRAIHDSNDDNFKVDSAAIINDIIKATIDDIMDLSSQGQHFAGTEMIDLSYEQGAFLMLNNTSWKKRPEIFRNVLTQKLDALKNAINRDRYIVPGHSAMISVATEYHITNGKHCVLNVLKDADGNFEGVEVFDPVANRWNEQEGITGADADGISIKYPAMGTREFVRLVFITEDEYINRVTNLPISIEKQAAIIDTIENLKEGAMLIPAGLEAQAMVSAGEDLDGDKMSVFFSTATGKDVAAIVKKSCLKSRAVDIDTKNAGTGLAREFDNDAWIWYAGVNIIAGNKSVGVVTNTFRVFTEGLLVDMTAKVVDFYTGLFAMLGNKNGKSKYESVITEDIKEYNKGASDVDDVKVFRAVSDAMQKCLENIKDCAMTKGNILAILEDMDVLGRAIQEMTIDAQKKFYSVFSKWMDKILSYTIVSLRYGFEFYMDKISEKDETPYYEIKFCENEAYEIKDNTIVIRDNAEIVEHVNEKGEVVSFALVEAFSKHRLFAANYAKEILNSVIEELNGSYAEDANSALEKNTIKARIARTINARAMFKINEALRMVHTANNMYRDSIAAISAMASTFCMNGKLQDKMDREIRKSVKTEYANIIAFINNELRRIAAENNINGEDMAALIDNSIKQKSSITNKVLKEERFLYMAKNSDISMFEKKLPTKVGLAIIDQGFDKVEVYGNEFVGLYAVNPIANVMDGEYEVEDRGSDGVFITRAIGDFVKMPVVDMDVRTVSKYIKNDEALANQLDKSLIEGAEYTIKCYDSRNQKFRLENSNGDIVVDDMYFGSGKALTSCNNAKEKAVLVEDYKNFTGKLVMKHVNLSARKNDNGEIYYNYIIALKK